MDIEAHLEKIERMVRNEKLAPEIAETDFQRLVAIVLSSRTREENTLRAMKALFSKFPDEHSIAKANVRDIEELIKPVGFYRQKARHVVEIARRVVDEGIKREREWLMSLPGVGRKTANVFLQLSGIPEIAVDTHVHRIANRIGWVETKRPEETEEELKRIVPRRLWSRLNPLLVRFGRQVCKPVKPKCGRCLLRDECKFYASQRKTN